MPALRLAAWAHRLVRKRVRGQQVLAWAQQRLSPFIEEAEQAEPECLPFVDGQRHRRGGIEETEDRLETSMLRGTPRVPRRVPKA